VLDPNGAERARPGISDGLVHLSVGLEPPANPGVDIGRALDAASVERRRSAHEGTNMARTISQRTSLATTERPIFLRQ
jgi:hypothetical protein